MLNLYITKGLVHYEGKYLLLKKARDAIPENVGHWECSGGKIQDGEKPEETIIREIKEETGLDAKIIREIPLLEKKNDKVHSKCHVYLLEVYSDKVVLSDEHSDYRWVEAEEVQNMDLVLFADLLLEYFNHAEKYLSE